MERIRAAALHRTGRTDAALETLATAIAIAGRQQAVLLDVRARTDLCRMLPSGPRRQRELAALRRLRKSLDEGADTSDIREADEVLRGA